MKNASFLAGKYKQQFLYKSFIPSRINRPFRWSDQAVLPEEEIDPERRNDWLEVQSYAKAMNHAIETLQRLPLSMRLIKETHKTVFSGVEGKHKQPGEIRRSQNWIGGSILKTRCLFRSLMPRQALLPRASKNRDM
jgi:hypothetical protein